MPTVLTVDAPPVSEALTASDPSKPFKFTTTPGKTYKITVTASGFDPALTIDGVAKPQSVHLNTTESHTFTAAAAQVEATVDVSGRSGAKGDFTIGVTQQAPVPTVLTVDAPPVSEALTASDPSKPFKFTTTPGKTYKITVTASGFDPALTIDGVAKPQSVHLNTTESHTFTAAAAQVEATVDVSGRSGAKGDFTIGVTANTGSAPISFVKIIDDGEPGYSDTGFEEFSRKQGFGEDVRQSGKAPYKNKTATWNFGSQPAGTYKISATWISKYNRPTNAPYTINGTETHLVNQQNDPRTFKENGVKWEDLNANYAHGGGPLVVTLTDRGADQYVIADAVRIQRVAP